MSLIVALIAITVCRSGSVVFPAKLGALLANAYFAPGERKLGVRVRIRVRVRVRVRVRFRFRLRVGLRIRLRLPSQG